MTISRTLFYDEYMGNTTAEKQVNGLSITLGIVLGVVVGLMLGSWQVAIAIGATVGFLLGMILMDGSFKSKRRNKKR